MCFFVVMFVFFLSVVMPCKLVFLYFICHCYIFGAGWVSKAIYDVILTEVLRFITLRMTELIKKLEWILAYYIPSHSLYLTPLIFFKKQSSESLYIL